MDVLFDSGVRSEIQRAVIVYISYGHIVQGILYGCPVQGIVPIEAARVEFYNGIGVYEAGRRIICIIESHIEATCPV